MKPLLSIVTVDYNGLELTARLVESLLRHNSVPAQIVVVDNGSQYDEAAELRRRYPSITAVRSQRNLGFAGGNNLGFEAAEGDYLLLLNNDTEIEADTLGFLCRTLKEHPEAGAVCPKIRFFQPPRAIQFAGYTPLSRITLRNALVGFGHTDRGQYDIPSETPYAHGAAMMVRREVLRTAGPMPECYFLYYEELDWSVRIRERGWTIRYDPRCTVFHKESATTGAESPLRTYYMTRNRLLFGRRNRRGAERLLAVAYQLTVALPVNVLRHLLRGRRDLAGAALRGARDFFRTNPEIR